MAQQPGADGSEDVNDFLVRIRDLGDKRDKEDEERAKKLEEEILQGRQERRAKRAERARSISPTKDFPSALDSPTPKDANLASPAPSQSIAPPVNLTPSSKSLDLDTTANAMNAKEANVPAKRLPGNNTDQGATSGSPISTGGAASWKHRPTSKGLDTISLAPTSPSESNTESKTDNIPSRTSITQSLSSKDASWFRQTSDRGIGSPAYRTTRSSDTFQTGGSPKLPGLSRESTVESEKQGSFGHESERSRSPSRTSSTYGTSNVTDRYSSMSSAPAGGLGSPTPLGSHRRFDSRASSIDADAQAGEKVAVAMSPSQGRLANDRPSSPTKGLGGFVQSAMLKRSDSVSKRWSVQSGLGSTRGGVAPGNRTDGGPLKSNQRMSENPIAETSYDTSGRQTNSRPGSSYSEATVVSNSADNETGAAPGSGSARKYSNDGFVKPALPSRPTSRSDSIASGAKSTESPATPSKTMDPRRWSPTKASWLESALNKPESPKFKPQAAQQPEWKRDINKLKQVKTGPQSPKSNDTGSAAVLGRRHDTESKVSSLDSVSGVATDSSVRKGSDPATQEEVKKPESGQTRTSISPEISHQSSTPPLNSGSTKPAVSSAEKDSSSARQPNLTEPVAESLTSQGKSTTSAASSKPKPPSPPIKDLRPKPGRHETATGPAATNEPEFKNVLGKLRKTETKNYVAPDELKNNILRGKAALNHTGGPQKSQRVDEFKESLLKQKQAIKSGGGSIRRNTIDEKKDAVTTASPVPEAIARRNRMNRSESTTSNFSTSDIPAKPAPTRNTPVASEVASRGSPKPDSTAPVKSSSERTSEPSPEKTNAPPLGQEMQKEKTNLHTREGSSPAISNIGSPAGRPSASKGSLAERLNPGLVGFLSRGPPGEQRSSQSDNTTKSTSVPDQPATLSHATKSRAKGPKRRPPQDKKPEKVAPTSQVSASQSEPSKPALGKISLPTSDDTRPHNDTTTPETPSAPAGSSGILEAIRRRTPLEPPVGSEFPFSQKDPDSLGEGDAGGSGEFLPATRYTAPEPPAEPEQSKEVDTSLPTRPTTQKPSPPPKHTSSPKPEIPRLSTPKTWGQPLADEASPQRVSSTDGPNDKAIEESRKRPPPPPRKPSSPLSNRSESPRVPPKPRSLSANKPSQASPHSSPFPQTSEASRIFSSFFDSSPKASEKAQVDPQSILLSKSETFPKINTLKKQIWEITGDGRKKELPSNQEYILFEESMYLCVHVFEIQNGTKTTQVHLWCGDGVSEAAVDDSQLFARKVARENSSKLEVLKQGKETSGFIQALGGIIITRRGSSARADSSTPYMLCGRRHIGQISFDEVDLSPTCLCSGYPYIISANSGRLYLWQGKGSAADELGCARLIGMDLGLTGEIKEITEGEEPDGFFDVFPNVSGAVTYQSADYWRLKANNSKYRNRLFRIDHSLGQRFGAAFWNRRGASSPPRPNAVVQEIEPFCQRDLESGHIHILDAFFEIYVIVGEQAHSRSSELATALVLAQEYSILAVSEQDRPFMPKSSVVLDGVPDECKRAFRKWDDRGANISHRKPITVLPLDAAIEAIR